MKRANVKGRLKRFLDDSQESSSPLPLIHTTPAYSFADIHEGDEIDPEYCENFEKELIYLFYGRPAYRTENSAFTDLSFNWPIVFILDPEKIDNITSIYPFDTGAFYLHLYKRFFSKNSTANDFELPGDLEYAAKLVGTYYRSEEEYVRGRSTKNLHVPAMNFEAEGIRKLSHEPALTIRHSEDAFRRDERSSAIEVHVESTINIEEATLAVVLPDDYLKLTSVVEALDRWGLSRDSVHYYEVIGFHENDSWLGQIYKIVLEVYRQHGFIARS